jgi:hypothetical protein
VPKPEGSLLSDGKDRVAGFTVDTRFTQSVEWSAPCAEVLVVTLSTRSTRRALGVAVAVAALGVLASCGHTTPAAQVPASNPVSSVSGTPKPSSSAAPARASAVIAAAKTAATTAGTAMAPSGDAVLDAMDKDLTALEQETVSLDSAAADSQEPAK